MLHVIQHTNIQMTCHVKFTCSIATYHGGLVCSTPSHCHTSCTLVCPANKYQYPRNKNVIATLAQPDPKPKTDDISWHT
jgi:hypothetical protein